MGVGRFEVSGPATDYATLRTELQKCQESLALFVARFQTADPEILEERRRTQQQLDTNIGTATQQIQLLLNGETETRLRERHNQTASRIEEIKQQRPDWA